MSRVEEALNKSRGKVRIVSGSQSRSGELTVFSREDSAEPGVVAYPAEDQGQVERTRVEPAAKAPVAAAVPAAPVRAVPPPPMVPLTDSGLFARPFRFDDAVEGKVVISRDTSPLSVEQYRRLAATLHGLRLSGGLRTVMISSALPRDGKTLTTTNLALTLSESYGQRVLVIDADLRRPSIHHVFGLDNKAGLAEGLRVGATGSLPVIEVSPTLTVLTAGTPDGHPMAALTSERMSAILKEAAARFDWVLIDTPPIELISDAQLLAAQVDGVVLVVGAGSTNHVAVTKTVNTLGRERIIGVVLNRVEEEQLSSSGRHYDDYYLRDGTSGSGSRR